MCVTVRGKRFDGPWGGSLRLSSLSVLPNTLISYKFFVFLLATASMISLLIRLWCMSLCRRNGFEIGRDRTYGTIHICIQLQIYLCIYGHSYYQYSYFRDCYILCIRVHWTYAWLTFRSQNCKYWFRIGEELTFNHAMDVRKSLTSTCCQCLMVSR